MFRLAIFILASASLPLLAGETRTWRDAEGTRSFEAEFVTRKNGDVTLLREDGTELTFDISKLHEDDRRWINLNYPPGEDGTGEKMPEPDAVFDTLTFGDNREAVTEKLKTSKMVENTVAGTFFGRTGLNGIYHTSHKIGGLYCYLFFDWTESGALKEITLQTEGKQAGDYGPVLEPCWKELIELISPIHGKPIQHMRLAGSDELQDGQMLASHLWRMEHGGTVLLGTSRLGQHYQVVVRFTREKIEPKRVPAAGP